MFFFPHKTLRRFCHYETTFRDAAIKIPHFHCFHWGKPCAGREKQNSTCEEEIGFFHSWIVLIYAKSSNIAQI